jgi:hypothetical protein
VIGYLIVILIYPPAIFIWQNSLDITTALNRSDLFICVSIHTMTHVGYHHHHKHDDDTSVTAASIHRLTNLGKNQERNAEEAKLPYAEIACKLQSLGRS